MKEIDNIVKKVLLESLNEKADEITQKIQEKISGEMEEGECKEGDCGEMKEIGFKKGLAMAARKKFGKTPKSSKGLAFGYASKTAQNKGIQKNV